MAATGLKDELPLLRVGDPIPNFTANTQKGSITLHDYITGSWAILFSHPADYTPVCTTEVGMISKLMKEFEGRDCKVIGISVDSVTNHLGWIKDVNETQGTTVDFPIIADIDGSIVKSLGFWHPNLPNSELGHHVSRSVLIMGPQRKVQMRMDYPTYVGRNFYEIIRALDAMQLAIYRKVGTPANWKNGEDVVILPSINNEFAAELFPKGFTEIKPYLRVTPQPDLD